MNQHTANSPRPWLAFTAIAMFVVMVDVDVTAVNLALVTIAENLKIGLATAQWIVNGYTTVAAALMVIGGKFGDVLGRRRVLFFAATGFALSSCLVGLSTGSYSIISARLLQGVFMAMILPGAIALIRTTFPPERQGFVVGLILSVVGFSQALGPTLGGVIINVLSWRWIFFVNIPVSLLAYFIGRGAIPETPGQGRLRDLHIPSAIFLTLALGLIVFALNEVSVWGMGSWQFLGTLGGGIGLLVGFVVMELSVEKPLLEIRVIFNRLLLVANGMRFQQTFIYSSLLFVLSLFMQNLWGFDPIKAGMFFMFLTLSFAFLSIPFGKWVDKSGSRWPVIAGMGCMTVATFLFAQLGSTENIVGLAIPMVFAGMGIAMLAPGTGTLALSSAPHEKVGTAVGILGTLTFMGSSLGVAISGWAMAWKSNQTLTALISEKGLSFTAAQLTFIKHIAVGVHDLPTYNDMLTKSQQAIIEPLTSQAFLSGFGVAMMLLMGMALLGVLIGAVFLREPSA